MDLQKVFTAVMILVFFAIPLIYVWKVRHPSRPLWKWFACFVVIIHGPPIIAGYLTGYLIDFTTYGLGHIFQMNYKAASDVARMVLTVLAVSTTIPGVYSATKIVRKPTAETQMAGAGALYSAARATHVSRG